MIVSWTIPTVAHVEHVARHMRAVDVEECRLMSGATPLDALTFGVNKSDVSFCALSDGKAVVIFGGSNNGTIWALGTDWVTKCPMTFARHSRTGMAMLWDALDCDVAGNVVWIDNSASIRWLRWLGASFSDERVSGACGGVFLPFVLERG